MFQAYINTVKVSQGSNSEVTKVIICLQVGNPEVTLVLSI